MRAASDSWSRPGGATRGARWSRVDGPMADWATIGSVGTAAGTMVLGLATFASVRSANRAARTAERSLQVGLRPVLMPSRPQDPEERIGWAFGHGTTLAPGAGYARVEDGVVYLAMALR